MKYQKLHSLFGLLSVATILGACTSDSSTNATEGWRSNPASSGTLAVTETVGNPGKNYFSCQVYGSENSVTMRMEITSQGIGPVTTYYTERGETATKSVAYYESKQQSKDMATLLCEAAKDENSTTIERGYATVDCQPTYAMVEASYDNSIARPISTVLSIYAQSCHEMASSYEEKLAEEEAKENDETSSPTSTTCSVTSSGNVFTETITDGDQKVVSVVTVSASGTTITDTHYGFDDQTLTQLCNNSVKAVFGTVTCNGNVISVVTDVFTLQNINEISSNIKNECDDLNSGRETFQEYLFD